MGTQSLEVLALRAESHWHSKLRAVTLSELSFAFPWYLPKLCKRILCLPFGNRSTIILSLMNEKKIKKVDMVVYTCGDSYLGG
jgi:hypothetical protein